MKACIQYSCTRNLGNACSWEIIQILHIWTLGLPLWICLIPLYFFFLFFMQITISGVAISLGSKCWGVLVKSIVRGVFPHVLGFNLYPRLKCFIDSSNSGDIANLVNSARSPHCRLQLYLHRNKLPMVN